ncbi:PrsW family glutamic-type intramembrane protease [Streptomyces sp. NPDC056669]|uniref:PrsW family glutamic-type intramembrane protease n=1 Tax=Streptomyces sp. NPDC056669 TaxID=3345903 RepID=UPI0036AE7C52
MAVLMVAATVYGVVQLLVLSSPTRSVRVSTVLLAIAVGVYGCGIVTLLLEYAYTRAVSDQPHGGALLNTVKTASYTVDPVVEELIKITPLLLAAWNVKIRRQWGLTDYVVTGAALGAGFGLLEAVARFGLDAARAVSLPTGGWMIPDSLQAPWIPGPGQVFAAWFPAPFSTLDFGEAHPAADTSPHLVYAAGCGPWGWCPSPLPAPTTCSPTTRPHNPAPGTPSHWPKTSTASCGLSRWPCWPSRWPPTCGRSAVPSGRSRAYCSARSEPDAPVLRP